MKVLYLILILFLAIGNCVAQKTTVPDYLTRSASIRVGDAVVGSGYYYRNLNSVYLVTAAHVLFQVDNKTELISSTLRYDSVEVRTFASKNFRNNQLSVEIKKTAMGSIVKHNTKDVAIVKIAEINPLDSLSFIPSAGVYIKKNAAPMSYFNKAHLLSDNDLLEGMNVLVLGYPSYLDQSKIPGGNAVYNFEYPLVQGGVLSGYDSEIGNIIISAPVFYGNSGGAVLYRRDNLKLEEGKLSIEYSFHIVGVVSSFIPFIIKDGDDLVSKRDYDKSNSGYTVVVPIHFAIELMK